ncbi:MAG: trypsin-like peptidase domain-containing protein [Myxococcales bacterium]|nr:trypsin-like peptidase domain-containing protein [Myxococcales bacterium]
MRVTSLSCLLLLIAACTPALDDDGACGVDDDCAAGRICRPSSGTCGQPLPPGALCVVDEECARGSVCVPDGRISICVAGGRVPADLGAPPPVDAMPPLDALPRGRDVGTEAGDASADVPDAVVPSRPAADGAVPQADAGTAGGCGACPDGSECLDGACRIVREETPISGESIIGATDWVDVIDLPNDDPIRLRARAVGYYSALAPCGDSFCYTRCTAWLASRSLVITNFHCIEDVVQGNTVASAVVNFEYWAPADYDSLRALRDEGFTCPDLVFSDSDYDIAVLRCDPGDGGRTPAESVGSWLEIDARAPVAQEAVYLLHQNCEYDPDAIPKEHCTFDGSAPGEATKKQSPGTVTDPASNGYGLNGSAARIGPGDALDHDADSLGGTSGAPLLGASTNRVLALHHAGNAVENHAIRFDRIFAAHPELELLIAADREAPCPAPQLQLPRDQADDVDPRVVFRWSTVDCDGAAPRQHRIQVHSGAFPPECDGEAGPGCRIDVNEVTEQASYIAQLEECTRYRWRVRSAALGGGHWSEVGAFTTACGPCDVGDLNACGACGPPPNEACNGADDDCDGRIDEGVSNACGACGPPPAEACN